MQFKNKVDVNMSDSKNEKSFKLLIASKNVHKIRECRSILQPLQHLDILSLRDFPNYTPPEETGDSFRDNAILKAEHAAKELQIYTLADDSGLIVPALNGEPGVKSARYAGNQATDADNRKKLLSVMQHLSEEDRTAYFECCVALSSPEGLKKCFSGACEGKILLKERGGGGFGYDPLFLKNEYSKTFAELEESLKNRISHRRKALDKMMVSLETLAFHE